MNETFLQDPVVWLAALFGLTLIGLYLSRYNRVFWALPGTAGLLVAATYVANPTKFSMPFVLVGTLLGAVCWIAAVVPPEIWKLLRFWVREVRRRRTKKQPPSRRSQPSRAKV